MPRIAFRPHGVGRLLGAAFLFVALATFSRADPFVLANTDYRTLPVSANGRTYTLSVSLPSSYASNPTRRYPVIYFADAYWDFPLFCMSTGNLAVDSLIPDVILVGLGYAGANPDVNALRQIDFTPGQDSTVDATGTTSGKAKEFLSVIEHEIIPLVESQYRVDPSFRVLAGSSYGGLFTTFAAFERPGLFQGYLAASPSLWWRNRELLTRETTTTSFPNARLFLSAGEEDNEAYIRAPTKAMYAQMRAHHLPGLAVAFWEVRGERHSSQKQEAYTRGLRFLFAPRAPMPSAVSDPAYNAPSTLINVSTRGAVGTGDGVLIAGFIVSGPNPKRVLIRAFGPGLSDFGVGGVLVDPKVSVHNASGASIAENDNWSSGADASAVTAAMSEAGAFALKSGSKDAALILTLEPGAYTAVVEGVAGTTGNALVEAYQLAWVNR